MPLSFKERKQILKKTNTLELTPLKLYSDKLNSDGLVTVIVPKFKNEFAQKFIAPKMKSADFKVNFDKLGSAVLSNMDGRKKVHEILKIVSEEFGDELIQAEERVVKFIFQLYEQKLISFNEINR